MSEGVIWSERVKRRDREGRREVERERERGRMLPVENGCCNLKPILIHRNDIKVEREGARAIGRGRERKIRKMRGDIERM